MVSLLHNKLEGWLFNYLPISRFQKVPTGPTKNLERLYNRVVVWSFGRSVVWLFATQVITASSHSRLCHTEQTRPNDQDDWDDQYDQDDQDDQDDQYDQDDQDDQEGDKNQERDKSQKVDKSLIIINNK
jgi:hypothetical protein